MNKVMLVVGAIVLLLIGLAGGFYAGDVYAQSQSQNVAATFARTRSGTGQQNAQAAAGPCGFVGRGGGGGFNRQGQNGGTPSSGQGQGSTSTQQQIGSCVARGQVKSVDASTGTVQISTPVNVVTVKVDNQTLISKTDTGSLSDVQVGERVTVFSRETGDSPTASAVQIQNGASLFGQ